MKYGIWLSIVLVLLVVLGAVFLITPPADKPTDATAPEKLREVALGDDALGLSTPIEVTDPSEQAGPHYEAAIEVYRSDRPAFEGRFFDEQTVQRAADHLVAAAGAGQVSEGFVDRLMPLRVGGGSTDNPLFPVASKVLALARQQVEDGEHDAAARTAGAVYVLGRRSFVNNQTLAAKRFGLTLMMDAGRVLYMVAGEDEPRIAALNASAEDVAAVYDAWEPKLKIVMSTDPHVGDLLNIAQHDEDRAFRIAATLHLGLAKHTDSNPGNDRAIEQYLEEAADSDDPLIAEAARLAQAFTVDDLRRMN